MTLPESSLLHQSWQSLPPKKRYQLMALLPFIDDPIGKMLILRAIARTTKDYKLIRTLPNSAAVVYDLFKYSLKWITEQPKGFSFPEVKADGWVFTAPGDRFETVTFGQLVELDSYFTRYLRTQREALLSSFLINLYSVSKQGKTDIQKAVAKIGDPYRLDALRMYGMIREKVFASFIHIFPTPKGTSKKSKQAKVDLRKIQDTTDMWHSVLFSLADSPAFQGMETAKAANMWEALTYLDEKAYQMKKSKESNST